MLQSNKDINFSDLDMHAQFSVNQSRPEDITMREDLSSIAFVGDDDFGKESLKNKCLFYQVLCYGI